MSRTEIPLQTLQIPWGCVVRLSQGLDTRCLPVAGPSNGIIDLVLGALPLE